MKRPSVLITPQGRFRTDQRARFPVLEAMLMEAWQARGLAWRLFVRDFSARYRQSFLGVLWSVILPVFTLGVFVAMNQSGLMFSAETRVPYPVYAIVGLGYWQFFTIGIVSCSEALVQAGSMITKLNFPKSALVFAASGHALVELLIRFLIIGFVSVWFGFYPTIYGVLLSVFSLLPLMLFFIGVGFVLSLMAAVFRDVLSGINMLLFGLMLLTPVVYTVRETTFLAGFNKMNPLNFLVNVPRDFYLYGASDGLMGYLASSVFAFVVFWGGWRFYHLAQSRIAERV